MKEGRWSPEEDEQLTVLWASGLSTVQIGLKMGRRKDAVIGRAHRLHLPKRPSPFVSLHKAKREKSGAAAYQEAWKRMRERGLA